MHKFHKEVPLLSRSSYFDTAYDPKPLGKDCISFSRVPIRLLAEVLDAVAEGNLSWRSLAKASKKQLANALLMNQEPLTKNGGQTLLLLGAHCCRRCHLCHKVIIAGLFAPGESCRVQVLAGTCGGSLLCRTWRRVKIPDATPASTLPTRAEPLSFA